MTYDIYLLRANLQKIIDKDRDINPDSYSSEYADGVNLVLDALTEITGVKFRHVHEHWNIM